ncbi:MAG: tetratricopeptide repeat protein [Nitrospirae bacterium YQR-1]
MKKVDMKIIVFFVLMAIFIITPAVASAALFDNPAGEGNYLYKNGKYDEAIKKYGDALKKSPDSGLLNYNAGTAYYKKGDYQQALNHFTKSLATTNPSLEMRSSYNIGNTHYMIGESMEKTDPAEALSLYEGALQYYKRALELNDSDKDARHNYELTSRRIRQLKEEMKKPQNKKNDKDKKGDKDKDKGKDQSKGNDKDKDKQGDDKDRGKQQQDKQGKENDKSQQSAKQDGSVPPSEKMKDNKGKGALPRTMTKEEARMLLEGLENDSVPRAMIDDKNKKGGYPKVTKDW